MRLVQGGVVIGIGVVGRFFLPGTDEQASFIRWMIERDGCCRQVGSGNLTGCHCVSREPSLARLESLALSGCALPAPGLAAELG